jgi:uncharacterized protein (UPF0332 family)
VASPETFKPREFLDLAAWLVQKDAASQAELRTSLSRAYYAVHLHAREKLTAARKIYPTRTGADHQLVIEALRRAGGPCGDQVDRLRVQRARADYNLSSTISAGQAKQMITLAESLWPRI